MDVKFYKHDSYLEMRRKFTGAWANLRLVIHRQSEKFWRGSNDELEDDYRFFPSETADGQFLILSGAMTKAAARSLLADFYSVCGSFETYIEPFIYENFADETVYNPENVSLDECNNF